MTDTNEQNWNFSSSLDNGSFEPDHGSGLDDLFVSLNILNFYSISIILLLNIFIFNS